MQLEHPGEHHRQLLDRVHPGCHFSADGLPSQQPDSQLHPSIFIMFIITIVITILNLARSCYLIRAEMIFGWRTGLPEI